MRKPVEKVLAYITRAQGERSEVLVFEHRESSEAGIQVPAGTVSAGESISQALLREVFEESGIRLLHAGRYLGRFEWVREARNEIHFRNVFHIAAPNGLPEEWVHAVSGGDEDGGLEFKFYWLDREACIEALAVEQGKYLGLLR